MDAIKEAEQVLTLEEVRAYVEEMQARPPMLDGRPLDSGQLVGHLMTAEVLLIKISRVFDAA